MYKFLLTLMLLLVFGGCATTSTPTPGKQQLLSPQSTTFVLLGSSPWDSKLRAELSKKGFKFQKVSEKNTAISKGNSGEQAAGTIETEARYGLGLSWVNLDHCVENNSMVINARLEVTDLQADEVLFVIKKRGFTGPCGPPRILVFEELANALADSWSRK